MTQVYHSTNARRCATCHQVRTCLPTCRDNALTFTGVMVALEKGSRMPAEPRSTIPRVPVWSLVSLLAGSVLVALGLILKDPVAFAVWSWLHG